MKNSHGKQFTLTLPAISTFRLYSCVVVTMMCTSIYQVISLPSLNSSAHNNLSFHQSLDINLSARSESCESGSKYFQIHWALSETCLSFYISQLTVQTTD